MIFKIADGREYFYQWDQDRQIIVSDPTITEVHFCNRTDDCSLVVPVEDGTVKVPNKLFQNSYAIRVFGYDGKATLHEATFEVKARTRPADYVYTEEDEYTIEYYLARAIDEAKANGEFNGDKGDPGPQGPQGEPGTPFTYDMFTEEQLEALRGPEGKQGPVGPEGPQGPKGDTGATGPQGKTGETGPRGPQGIQGERGIQGKQGDEGPQGPQGIPGEKGDKGDKGDQGEKGETGEAGIMYVTKDNDRNDIKAILNADRLPVYTNTLGSNSAKYCLPLIYKDGEYYYFGGVRDNMYLTIKYDGYEETWGVVTSVSYATKEYVDNELSNLDIPEADVDLTNYYTKEEVNRLIPDTSNFITEVPAEYITETELNAKGYLTEHQSLADYAKKSEIPSVEGLATEEYVDSAIEAFINVDTNEAQPLYTHTITLRKPIIDVETSIEQVTLELRASVVSSLSDAFTFETFSQYVKQNGKVPVTAANTDTVKNTVVVADYIMADTTTTGALLAHVIVTDYSAGSVTTVQEQLYRLRATDTNFSDSIALLGIAGILPEGSGIDLTDYYTKEETDALIPSLDGYATEAYVNEAIANIDIPEGGGGGSAEGAVSYAEEQELTVSEVATARKNLNLPYVTVESITSTVDNFSLTAAEYGYTTIRGNWPELNKAPAGTKFTITVSVTNLDFSETVECEKKTATTYVVTSDVTNCVVFAGGSAKSIYETSMYISKKNTSSLGASITATGSIVAYVPTNNNLMDPALVNSDVLNKFKIKYHDSSSTPTFILQPDTGSSIASGNFIWGRSNSASSADDSVILGYMNTATGNATPYFITGERISSGFNESGSGSSRNHKCSFIGDNLRGTQHTKYASLTIGTFNDRTSKYLPAQYNTKYNVGDIVSPYAGGSGFGLWRCIAEGATSSNLPTGTNSNTYWEYIDDGTTSEYLFTIGNGTAGNVRSNAFHIDYAGNVVAAGTVTPTGADYAEYFEFEDGNPNREDRIGYLVELIGNKIRLANGNDILGAVSSTMGVIGDAEEMNWHGKYERDEFGRPVFETVEYTEINPETKEEETKTYTTKKISKDYDPTRYYAPRSDRPEWAPIGLLGKVLVRHDGTLVAGDYVKAINGIASKADERTNIRVLEVISDSVIKVLIK